MEIAGQEYGDGSKTLIVAELGVNHNGSLDTALQMVSAARAAGADAVKVQYFDPESFCSQSARYKGESQIDIFSRYALQYRHLAAISEQCKREGVLFFGTPDSVARGRMLLDFGAPCLKVGSDDIVYLELVEGLAKLGVPLLISTGMANQVEIINAYNRAADYCAVMLLHCVSLYPTHRDQVNLSRMTNLLPYDSYAFGFSDHTFGTDAAPLAVAMGAIAVEKHFTLDHGMAGPDHAFSADPRQFAEMVSRIRSAELLLGTGQVEPSAEEMEMRAVARRSIVAARDIRQGATISREDIAFKRPGTGFLPYQSDEVIGRRAARAIDSDAVIMPQDLQ